MSNLHGSGGSRDKAGNRLFGAGNIRRYIQQQKPDHTDASGSIADRPHAGTREQQRRKRQQERKARKEQGNVE